MAHTATHTLAVLLPLATPARLMWTVMLQAFTHLTDLTLTLFTAWQQGLVATCP